MGLRDGVVIRLRSKSTPYSYFGYKQSNIARSEIDMASLTRAEIVHEQVLSYYQCFFTRIGTATNYTRAKGQLSRKHVIVQIMCVV